AITDRAAPERPAGDTAEAPGHRPLAGDQVEDALLAGTERPIHVPEAHIVGIDPARRHDGDLMPLWNPGEPLVDASAVDPHEDALRRPKPHRSGYGTTNNLVPLLGPDRVGQIPGVENPVDPLTLDRRNLVGHVRLARDNRAVERAERRHVGV